MAERIIVTVDGVQFEAELNDTSHAARIHDRFPVDVRMSRWGAEYYGAIGLHLQNAPGARDVVDIGAIAYWPPGDAICFFFGRTPASTGSEPRAASDVTVVGHFLESSDLTPLSSFPNRIRARFSGF